MANKAELQKLVDNLQAENKNLRETIVALNEANVDLNELVDNLQAAREEKPLAGKPEKTVKLYWNAPVDASPGGSPSAFGYPLILEEGIYFSDIPESRVKSELARPNGHFNESKPKGKGK